MQNIRFQKPRVKSCYYIFPLKNNHLQVGVTHGHAFSISDEGGRISYLLGLLNGERTLAQITGAFRRRYGEIKQQEIEDILSQLDKHSLIEDAALIPPVSLSSQELQRYQNQLAFFLMFTKNGLSKYDVQARLKNSAVTLIGLGGGGSHILISLAAMGVGKIVGVDFDKVERKNLNRQILYTENEVGKLKTDVATRRVKEINPHVKFEAVNMRVDSLPKARRVIKNTDFVICTADGPVYTLYEVVNRACVERGVPWISFGAVEATGIVGPLIVPGKTACYQCIIDEKKRKNPDYLKNIDYIRRHEKRLDTTLTYPSFLPLFSYCGSLVVLETTKLLTGFVKPTLYGKIYSIDFATMKPTTESFERDFKCAICRDVKT